MRSTASLQASTLVMLVLAGVLGGCMRARVEESRELPTVISGDEAVVVLARPRIEGTGAESDFVDCIGSKLSAGRNGLKVHDDESFTDRLFPWFEPGTVPAKAESIAAVLAQPGVSEEIAATGVRYVVWVDGGTRKTDGGGSIACGAAPGAAGCIGFGWWEKESDYEAVVWDLKQARSAGTVGTNVTGTSALVGAIVPLPFVARVQGTACSKLSAQLRSFLAGRSPGDG